MQDALPGHYHCPTLLFYSMPDDFICQGENSGGGGHAWEAPGKNDNNIFAPTPQGPLLKNLTGASGGCVMPLHVRPLLRLF